MRERESESFTGLRGLVMVPLAFIKKGPLRGLDTLGPDGTPMPVMESGEVHRMVTEMVMIALTHAGVRADEAVRAVILRIVDPLGTVSVDAVSRLCSTGIWAGDRLWPEATVIPGTLIYLIETLVTNTPLIGLLPSESAGKRQVLKLSYLWSVAPRRRGEGLRLVLASFGGSSLELRVPLFMNVGARSHLFEFQAPAQLCVERIDVSRMVPPLSADGRSIAMARILVRVPVYGLRATAMVATGITSAEFFASLQLLQDRGNSWGGGVGALFLSSSAVFIGLLGFRQETSFVSRILLPLRGGIVGSALLLLALAGCAAASVGTDVIRIFIESGLAVSVFVFVAMLLLPLLGRERKRKHSRL
ncbi:hypothetical protein [Mycetocola saprophilus]|uniref:hypothetical protein n=1 Tax=Mycetocola saprophilus TaxID=76636 RepID=UPI0012DC8FAD|nr:hypothetical protein [Mycetocola saprophilus]